MKMGLNYQSYFSAVLVLVIILLLSFFFYKKFISPYTAFPTSWTVLRFVFDVVAGRVPKDTKLSSYIFQSIVKDCKAFMSEGFYTLWLPKPIVVVFNEEAVKIISNEQLAIDKSEFYEGMTLALGNGLINSCGELWRHRRKMLQPAFQTSVIKKYVSVFNENSASMVESLMQVMGEPVEIIHYLKNCTITSLWSSLLAVESYSANEHVDFDRIITLVDKTAELVSNLSLNPLVRWKLTRHFFYDGRRCRKYIDEGCAIIEKMLEITKDAALKTNQDKLISKEEHYLPAHKSFIDIVMEHQLADTSSIVEDLKNEFLTVAVAGYHSISYAALWCLFLLANDQEVQDQFYNEVEHLKGKELSYEDIKDLTYVDCVVKETLRLYPVVPIYSRLIDTDIQCSKYTIPKGSTILLLPYLLHRNPEAFPNPEKFDPERFRCSGNNHPWSYTPFSEGIRNCIGKYFALIQIKIMLIQLLLNFKVTSVDRAKDIEIGWEITLMPVRPLMLRFTPRETS